MFDDFGTDQRASPPTAPLPPCSPSPVGPATNYITQQPQYGTTTCGSPVSSTGAVTGCLVPSLLDSQVSTYRVGFSLV